MAKKPVLVAAIAFAAGVALGAGVILKSCGPSKAYWIERSIYDRDVKVQESKTEAALVIVAEKNQVIAEKTAEITALIADAGKPSPAEQSKDAEISTLEAKVSALESQGDIVGALAAAKTEISAWAEKFSLAERRHQDSLSALNNAWQVKFDAQVVISDAGWAAYDREHALRLTSDALRVGLEKKLYGGKFWKYVALGEPVIFGIVAIFGK